MADQARWFKLWCSAPADDDIQALSPGDRWAWAAFGAYTKLHGTAGKVKVSASNAALAAELGVPPGEPLIACLHRLPHLAVIVTEPVTDDVHTTCKSESRSDTVTVLAVWRNWHKYQVDDSSQRVAKYRSNVTPKKRREEKLSTTPLPPRVPGGVSEPAFEQFYQDYPRKVAKPSACKAWRALKPTEAFAALIQTGLTAHLAYWRRHGTPLDKIPHPASWLNQRRWEDDLGPAQADQYAGYPRT